MDERSFFGSLLHVCYAPEFETVQETREKLQDRRKYIAKATNQRGLYLNFLQNLNISFQWWVGFWLRSPLKKMIYLFVLKMHFKYVCSRMETSFSI